MSPGRNTCHPVRSTGFILEPMCYKARTDSFKLFSDFQVSPILCLHQHTQTHKQIDINKTNGNKIFNILWTFLIFCRYLSTVENIVLPPQRINEPGQWTFGLAVCSSIYIVMFTAWCYHRRDGRLETIALCKCLLCQHKDLFEARDYPSKEKFS